MNPASLGKKNAALAALPYVQPQHILGVGTGSTVAFFIEALAALPTRPRTIVSSSQASTTHLQRLGFTVTDLNDVDHVDLYVDGADEINPHKELIKGGGAALTGEKILVAMSRQFICIADASKEVTVLGKFPLPIEVIPMSREYVMREIVKLGGKPVYRKGVITDYGNHIIDVHGLNIPDPKTLETTLNQITGAVTNGLFAIRPADVVLIGR